jgi:hypothetical protein
MTKQEQRTSDTAAVIIVFIAVLVAAFIKHFNIHF